MAIALDTSTDGGNVSATSLTYSHTCTGSNLVLFVSVIYGTADNVTGVTYNGVAMTQLGKQQRPGGSRFTYLYGLVNPTTGANNVVISNSASDFTEGASVSYTGVKQSGLPDAFVGQNYTAQTVYSTNITTIADDCWLTGLGYGGTVSAGTNATLRQTMSFGSEALFDSNSSVGTAGSKTINVNTTSSSGTTLFASFAPAGEEFSISESLSLSETSTNLRGLVSTTNESLSLSETISALKGISFTIAESLGLVESYTYLHNKLFTIAESLNVVEIKAYVQKKWSNLSKSTVAVVSNKAKAVVAVITNKPKS